MNTHFIVGPNRMCLCGQHDSGPVTCGDLLAAIIRTRATGIGGLPDQVIRDTEMVFRALLRLAEDCDRTPAQNNEVKLTGEPL